MGTGAMRQAGETLLVQARAIRSAYPDEAAMCGVTVGPEPSLDGWPALRRALTYLRDEMLLVRDGRAEGVRVLDDEIAHTQRVLDETEGEPGGELP